MPYSKSESDFNFAINSVFDFDSVSESGSESDSSSAFMNLAFVFFLLYICTLLNEPADIFSFQFS